MKLFLDEIPFRFDVMTFYFSKFYQQQKLNQFIICVPFGLFVYMYFLFVEEEEKKNVFIIERNANTFVSK